ncbi:MAG: hypothetical protein CMA03_01395, partial [Euryarchaeota archaeon]|nr:hypothetical protein [Euryarchaeota archaeon]
MLALMMVTSTFAAIGTTAAGPSGMETVMWEADNGNHVTHADGEHVYEYADPWDAVYDFRFVSDGLELDETYEIHLELFDMSTGMIVVDNWFGWTAYDNDGDGVADNSSEFLINGADIEYVTNDTCYDGVAILHHVDAAGSGMEVAYMHQLIGFGDYDCDMDHPYEHVVIDFSQDWDVTGGHPHFDSVEHALNNISITVHDLMEAPDGYCWDNDNEVETDDDEANCDNSDGTYTWVIPSLSYDLEVHAWYHNGDGHPEFFENVEEGV